MSYGFDLGNLRSDAIGLSYVGKFTYAPGDSTAKDFVSDALAFATDTEVMVAPQVGISASTVPQFPSISATLSTADKRIRVTASGGNVKSTILVFVR